MSSVLNAAHRTLTSYQSGVSLSLLGASAYTEGAATGSFHTTGVRYKTSLLRLNTLDVRATTPLHSDWQLFRIG